MRILLVDDEVELASALAERLDLRGMATDWAATADQALALAQAKAYDLALLDIRMPRVGGVELKARLQELDPHMKFIFLTGFGSAQDIKPLAEGIGDDCYLIKPVDIQVLIRCIREELNIQEGEDETSH